MAKQARQQGGQPPSGGTPSGYGWTRPGYLTMPYAANDNRLTAQRLLRQRRFWIWAGLILGFSALVLLRG